MRHNLENPQSWGIRGLAAEISAPIFVFSGKFPVSNPHFPVLNPAPTMSHPTFRIAIGADHGAFELKNAVVAHLKAVGHEVEDFGTHSAGSVDYADYANIVARHVADGTYDFGILACTSGVGMSIAANRHRHVRAASVRSVDEATITRSHNDANVL